MRMLGAVWGIVLDRWRVDWPMVLAAWLIVVLSSTLLSAAFIYGDAVATAGLRRTLSDAPATDANLQVGLRSRTAELAVRDAVVSASLQRLPAPGRLIRSGRSDSFALADQPGDVVRNLAVFAFFEEFRQHATLVQGAWPPEATAPGPVPVAIHASTAELMGWRPGTELPLVSRRDESVTVVARVVGVYAPDDATEPYWWADSLALEGAELGRSFDTFGPLVTSRSAFLAGTGGSGSFYWRFFPTFGEVALGDIAPLRAAVDRLLAEITGVLGAATIQPSLRTELGSILADVEAALLASRTAVLLVTLQLGALAAYALLLTANQIIDRRRGETALLRSRGAATAQLGAIAAAEGLLVAIPAVLAGPPLAAVFLRLLNEVGPLAQVGLRLEVTIPPAAWALAAAAGLAGVAILVLPLVLPTPSFVSALQARGRQLASSMTQRVGLDLALLAVAAIAIWQLRLYGAPLTRTIQGGLGIDPLLVAAPAIGLVAGAILALRVVPLLGAVADLVVAPGRAVVSALGAWQVGRRPQRYARSALLLMLALALGVFAVSYERTWSVSQREQADFRVGADLLAQPGVGARDELRTGAVGGLEGRVPGVGRAVAFSQRRARVGGVSAQALGLDAGLAPVVVRMRPDLATGSLGGLMGRLAAARPNAPLPQLPGEPVRLRLEVALAPDPAAPLPDQPSLSLAAVLLDGAGIPLRTAAQPVALRPGPQVVEIPLTVTGSDTAPRAPMRLAGVELRIEGVILPDILPDPDREPDDYRRSGWMTVLEIATSSEPGGGDWQPVAAASGGWRYLASVAGTPGQPGEGRTADSGGPEIRFDSGVAQRREGLAASTFVIQPAALAEVAADAALPVIVDDRLAGSSASGTGAALTVNLLSELRPAEVVGVVDAFPGTDATRALVVYDLPTLALRDYSRTLRLPAIDGWWLSVAEERAEAVSALLAEPAYASHATSRWQVATSLLTDPVALGLIGALSLAAVAATAFALVGFITAAAMSTRERLVEFGLLRALGLSPLQLSGWLLLENAILVVVSVGTGTLLGWMLAWLVLPFVTVTGDGSAPVPPVAIQIPWDVIGLLCGAVAVTLAVMVGLLALSLRRIGLGSTLRLGEPQ
ncbi:MAG: ABC transporter permease [Candidatus Limnocylindria bacterium]